MGLIYHKNNDLGVFLKAFCFYYVKGAFHKKYKFFYVGIHQPTKCDTSQASPLFVVLLCLKTQNLTVSEESMFRVTTQ